MSVVFVWDLKVSAISISESPIERSDCRSFGNLRRQPSASKSAWEPVGAATKLALVRQAPLGHGNPVAMTITSSACHDCTAGVSNGGYWGMALRKRSAYHISLYLRSILTSEQPIVSWQPR